jgi:hypothetical protein
MKCDIYLASNWPTSKVRKCLRKKDKKGLVHFLRERHEERFFKPLRHLKSARGNLQGYGFAMMAVCALLVETIQSYRDGLPTTYYRELNKLRTRAGVPSSYQLPANLQVSGRVIFKRFFHTYRNEFDHLSGVRFYSTIRNGLLHQGQTKAGWTLSKAGPQVWDRKTIFRDNFAEALEGCFKMYLAKLEIQNWNSRLWINTARKIWWLIRLS